MRRAAAWVVTLALGVGCAPPKPDGTSASAPGAASREEAAATPTPAPVAEAPAASGSLAGTGWRAADSGAAAPSGSTPTLIFESVQHAAGSTGCNRFSGTVTMEGASLRFGPLLTTRRGCPPPVMEREKDFLGALEACRSWRTTSGESGRETLELVDESGAVVLRLERTEEGAR